MQAAAVVPEQHRAVLGLQRLNLLGDGGLGQMQPLGGPAVIQGFAQGQKGLQFAFHFGAPCHMI